MRFCTHVCILPPRQKWCQINFYSSCKKAHYLTANQKGLNRGRTQLLTDRINLKNKIKQLGFVIFLRNAEQPHARKGRDNKTMEGACLVGASWKWLLTGRRGLCQRQMASACCWRSCQSRSCPGSRRGQNQQNQKQCDRERARKREHSGTRHFGDGEVLGDKVQISLKYRQLKGKIMKMKVIFTEEIERIFEAGDLVGYYYYYYRDTWLYVLASLGPS